MLSGLCDEILLRTKVHKVTVNLELINVKHAKVIEMSVGKNEQGNADAATWRDPKTGFEWQCESVGKMTWNQAQAYARSLCRDSKTDWRLPAVRELETLLDRTRYRPVMRAEIPFRDTLSYWSSTTFGHNKNSAWIVMFDGAYVLSYYKTNEYHVRCVRG